MNIYSTNINTIKDLINSLPREEFNKLVNELITRQQSSSINNLYKEVDNVRNESHFTCPHCGSIHVRKDGHSKGLQRYECVDCTKKFAPTTDSVFFKTHKHKDVWFNFLELMISGVSIRKSAEICKVNKETALIWRHKIIHALANRIASNKLKGIIEIDDTFFRFSFKGKKGQSCHDVETKRGISNNLICYTTGVDRSGKVVAVFNGMGKNNIDKMNSCFKNKIINNEDTLLLTDCEHAYEHFANEQDLKIIQTKADNYSRRGYKHIKRGNLNMNSVNSFHSMLKSMIKRTRGVGRKYLHNYIQWVAWSKQVTKLTFAKQLDKMFYDCCKQTI